MKKTLLSLVVLLFIGFSGFSQTNQSPSTEIIYKIHPAKNLLIEQVKELTNYDDQLTEKVIQEINLTHKAPISQIVNDSRYLLIANHRKQVVIKKSEVKAIIKRFKQ